MQKGLLDLQPYKLKLILLIFLIFFACLTTLLENSPNIFLCKYISSKGFSRLKPVRNLLQFRNLLGNTPAPFRRSFFRVVYRATSRKLVYIYLLIFCLVCFILMLFFFILFAVVCTILCIFCFSLLSVLWFCV